MTSTPAHGWTRASCFGVWQCSSAVRSWPGPVLFSTGEFDQAAALESPTSIPGDATEDAPAALPPRPSPSRWTPRRKTFLRRPGKPSP
ncbi:MAG: hypothetical protein R2854_22205 [Caldilineaceae bacterium]